jgi:hypothetical protein
MSRFDTVPSPFSSYLYAVKGVSKNDLWAAGVDGVLEHYDGTSWKAIPTGINNTLFDISVVSKDDVWFAGNGTTVGHWDGSSFKTLLGGRKTLKAVWGGSPSDIWAVGSQGTIRHFDGSSWKDVPSPLGAKDLLTLWGSSATDIWAAGDGLIHYDGKAWTKQTGDLEGAYSMWGTASNRIWASAGSGRVGRYDGTKWNIERPPGLAGGVYCVAGSSEQNVWAVDEMANSARFNGSTWQSMGNLSIPGVAVQSGMVVVADGTVWVASLNSPGVYVRWKPSTQAWDKVTGPGGGTAGTAMELWANRPDDIWGVGVYGSIHHFNGTTWDVSRPDSSYGGYPGYGGPGNLLGIWGAGDNNIWVVGDEGVILHRSGN